MPQHEFKLLLVGNFFVGKTSFVERHLTGDFEPKHECTLGVEETSLTFYSDSGDEIVFKVCDLGGVRRLPPRGPCCDSYFAGGHCAIIMFDLICRITYKDARLWYSSITDSLGKRIPTALVGNKADIADRKVKLRQITFHRKKNLHYFDLSVKTNFYMYKPLKALARELMGDPTLKFVNHPLIVEALATHLQSVFKTLPGGENRVIPDAVCKKIVGFLPRPLDQNFEPQPLPSTAIIEDAKEKFFEHLLHPYQELRKDHKLPDLPKLPREVSIHIMEFVFDSLIPPIYLKAIETIPPPTNSL